MYVAGYIEGTRDTINEYFYNNYYKNGETNKELQVQGKSWIKSEYAWMNSENIKRAFNRGMYFTWHG